MLLHEDNKWHYTFIKNFHHLLTQMSKYKGTRFWCDKCLYVTQYEKVMQRHEEDCKGIDQSPCKVIMPPPGDTIRFKNIRKQLKAPFICYCDFECLNVPVHSSVANSTATKKLTNHVPCSFSYVVVKFDGTAKEPVLYRAKDRAKMFHINFYSV